MKLVHQTPRVDTIQLGKYYPGSLWLYLLTISYFPHNQKDSNMAAYIAVQWMTHLLFLISMMNVLNKLTRRLCISYNVTEYNIIRIIPDPLKYDPFYPFPIQCVHFKRILIFSFLTSG